MEHLGQIPEQVYQDVRLSIETGHITGDAWFAILIAVGLVAWFISDRV